jgi:hypothetical protein
MEEIWYFARDGRRMGPFSFEQLKQMAVAGILNADDSLLRLGEQQWAPARNVTDLFSAAPGDVPSSIPTTPRIGIEATNQPMPIPSVRSDGPVDDAETRKEPSSPGPTVSLPSVPTFARAAGVIWILFGSIALLIVLLSVAATNDPVAALFSGVLLGSFAIAFMIVGIQTVGGWARDVLGNGIGSLVFGIGAIVGGVETLPVGVILIVIGLLLFSAGVFALVGRGEYKKWRHERR